MAKRVSLGEELKDLYLRYDRVVAESARRCGEAEEKYQELDDVLQRAVALADSYGKDLLALQKRYDEDIKHERRRCTQALDTAEEAASAAGSIARITANLQYTLETVTTSLQELRKK